MGVNDSAPNVIICEGAGTRKPCPAERTSPGHWHSPDPLPHKRAAVGPSLGCPPASGRAWVLGGSKVGRTHRARCKMKTRSPRSKMMTSLRTASTGHQTDGQPQAWGPGQLCDRCPQSQPCTGHLASSRIKSRTGPARNWPPVPVPCPCPLSLSPGSATLVSVTEGPADPSGPRLSFLQSVLP